MIVIVDETLEGVADVLHNEKGRALGFVASVASIVGAAALGNGHTQPVGVGAGIISMVLCLIAPYGSRWRPTYRSGPPIDPASDLAAVESAVHNRIAMEAERVDARVEALQTEMRERAELVDRFLATLEGGSRGVAIAAGDVRARLRSPAT